MKRLSPILWPGDKTLLGPQFLELLAPKPGGRVLDPFCGSMGIHLHHAHPIEVGDLDRNLCDVLMEISRDSDRLLAQFSMIPSYEAALVQAGHPYQFKRAAAFLYVNRASRFPHVRYNKAGKFNCSFYHDPKLTDAILAPLRARLAGVQVRNEDYRWVLREASDRDTVVLDPPYIGTGEMYRAGSAGFDHPELIRVAESLRLQGTKVIVTLNDCERARELTRDADRILTLDRTGTGRFSGNVPFRDLIAVYELKLEGLEQAAQDVQTADGEGLAAEVDGRLDDVAV